MTTRHALPKPVRGEIWSANLSPVVGHEQDGMRPVLIVSNDTFNASPAERVVVVPITSKGGQRPYRVAVTPPDGGLTMPGWVLCDQIRSISTERLRTCSGAISDAVLAEVEDQLALLLVV